MAYLECLVFSPRFRYFIDLFEDIFSSILTKSPSKPEIGEKDFY